MPHPDIFGRVLAVHAREPYPVRANYISQVGGDCLRQQVYSRVRWAEAEPMSPETALMLEEGNLHAASVIKNLVAAGFEVRDQETYLTDEDLLLSGRMDGRLVDGGEAWLMEIKSMNPHDWDAVNSVADLASSRKPWLRKYPAQLNIYLHLDLASKHRLARPEGVFILKNKINGAYKVLWMEYDGEAAEATLDRVGKVNEHVELYKIAQEDEYLPERIEYDEKVCGFCPFRMICLPDRVFGDGVEILDDESLREMIQRRADLKGAVEEYESIDRALKGRFKGRPDTIIGDWRITSKEVERAGYTVEATRYWTTTIRRLTR